MDIDLTKFSDSQLQKILEMTEKLAEQNQQDEWATYGKPDDVAGAEAQAKSYIARRKANVRLIDDKENAAIRKQVRAYLKKKKIIKD